MHAQERLTFRASSSMASRTAASGAASRPSGSPSKRTKAAKCRHTCTTPTPTHAHTHTHTRAGEVRHGVAVSDCTHVPPAPSLPAHRALTHLQGREPAPAALLKLCERLGSICPYRAADADASGGGGGGGGRGRRWL
jgi:hypothetical protein